MDLQRVVHEHLIISSVRPLVLRNHKLVLVLSEIQTADDPVQLVLTLVCLPYGAAYLENEIILEMLYCGTRLLLCGFPERFQFVAPEIFQQLIVRNIIPYRRGECAVRIISHITSAFLHKLLIRLFLGFTQRVEIREPLPLEIIVIHGFSAGKVFLEFLLIPVCPLCRPLPALYIPRLPAGLIARRFASKLLPKATPKFPSLLHDPCFRLQQFLVKLLNLLLVIPDRFLYFDNLGFLRVLLLL
ncbi:hypothetical protein IMSAGC020_01630 [Lachnospiraceae bacterium]|nr:hypothetical protein IMSAGC020_01630 [Lachnospiraceae bacterium]